MKKNWWTLVHKQKRYSCSYWPTQADIFGRQHFGPLGRAAPQFLHALQIDQALLAHTQTGMGSSPKKINRENLKFGLTFSMWATIASGLINGSIFSKLFPGDVPWGMRDKMGITFGRPAPKIWKGEKTSKIRRDFWQLSTLIAISPKASTIRHIANGKSILSITTPSTLGEKMGDFWSTNKNVIDSPKRTFLEGISALGACCPLKFLHGLQIDQVLLAHTQTGMECPKKI